MAKKKEGTSAKSKTGESKEKKVCGAIMITFYEDGYKCDISGDIDEAKGVFALESIKLKVMNAAAIKEGGSK